MKAEAELVRVSIDKLVYGGQGLATLPDGRKVFVWNALPGEEVAARIFRNKPSYAEAVAERIITPSSERRAPRDDAYLATSPWQILDYKAENGYKRNIAVELFARENVSLPSVGDTISKRKQWRYRNKMEYSFWGDETGLQLALYERGTHHKQSVKGSSIAMASVDSAANGVLMELRRLKVRAGDLKTIIVRSSQQGDTVAALFTKTRSFPELRLPVGLNGIQLYYSNPKSPASVPTGLLQEQGTVVLQDTLLQQRFFYDVNSFFQVNPPVFERVLERIREYGDDPVLLDMYAGTGTIGLSVGREHVELVEIDAASAAMARENARVARLDVEIIEAPAERALQRIVADKPVIFDPPRAGLHQNIVDRILAVQPPKVIYLSCNPATQARDVAKLQQEYNVVFFEVYNFFPHTPHIETLAILAKK